MTKEKIVLVDDEPDILQFLSYNLEKANYEVYTATNGAEGVALVKKINPDLVILDVMMPTMDGMEACKNIREQKEITQPVVAFLTSRAEDYSHIAGLQAGADDYIAKPIRPRLLVARIETLLRRKHTSISSLTENKSFFLDKDRFLLVNEGVEQILPKKEFELLAFLMTTPGKVFTRDQILFQVWGNEAIVGERTIDVHIRKLREKIGDTSIRTIKGVGYTFNIAS
ncbi:MAG: response regulator transcription factor [Lishizhenia sp.]